MDRFIVNSFLSLDNLYGRFPVLDKLAINDFQLLTAVWNIFLVLIPLAIFWLLKKYWRRTRLVKFSQKSLALALFILWLLFFPNTAYLITDVRHLLDYCPADSINQVCLPNAWMIIFFFAYSAIGWVSFYYLLKMMSDLVRRIMGECWGAALPVLVIPLTALGVLLGLLNRFNSWDVFIYPGTLAQVVWLYFSQLDYFANWAVFSIFLYLLYFAGDAIFKKVKS